MYSNRHLCMVKKNLIKHLDHHREQFLHEASVRDFKIKGEQKRFEIKNNNR